MPAYVIVDMDVRDPLAYEEYRKLAAPSVAAYGGTYIVRGGASEVLEGDWIPARLVVLEFPSVEQARQWWDSPEYQVAREVRKDAAHGKFVLVESYTG